MSRGGGEDSEIERLKARVAGLEAQLAAKPPIDRASLYRLAAHAPWGVMAINAERRVDFANNQFQRWLLVEAPAVGLAVDIAVAPCLLDVLEATLGGALDGTPFEDDLALPDRDGAIRQVRLTVAPRTGGGEAITGVVVGLYDMTDSRALDAAVRENEVRLRLAMRASHMALWDYDVASGVLTPNEQLSRLLGHPNGGLPTPEALRSGFDPEDWERMVQVAREARALGEFEVEAELRHRGPDDITRTLLLRLEMVPGPDGGIVKGRGALVDITDRKKAELSLRLMVNELNHRVKNTLAVVQSLARQTLRRGVEAETAWREFDDRLIALAVAHDLITVENWSGADLRTLVSRSLASASSGRVSYDGATVRLSPKLALTLSMAMHELLTNAFKYGALSGPAGQVTIAWSVANERLDLRWTEDGGPTVAPPARSGFGARLLRSALATDVGGVAELRFLPSGISWRIDAPLQWE